MKKLLLFLSLFISAASFGQTSSEISRILNGISTDLFVTGQGSQSASGNNILLASAGTGSFDAVSGGSVSYRSFFVQIIGSAGIASGQILFEGSNDNTTFVPVTWYDDAVVTGATINVATSIAASTNRFFSGKLTYRYFRCRISTVFSGGTVQALVRYSTQDYVPRITTSAQATAANLNATVTATNLSTNMAQVGGTNTVNAGVAGTQAVGGNVAHSGAATTNPMTAGGRVVQTTIATVDATLVAGDVAHVPLATGNQVIQIPYATSELGYTFNLTSPATTTTLQPLVLASGTANIRNYITSLTIQSDALGTAGNGWIVDGQGAIGTSVTIATPGVFTSTAHDLKIGDAIVFTSLGTITGISTNTVYYITATSFAATTFTVATAPGGTALQITGSTSAFTFYRVLQPLRFQTTAIGTPSQIVFQVPIRSISNGAINFLIPSSLTSGNIYITANGYRGF